MADSAAKSELRNTWESAAPGWAKWEHVFAASLSSATEELLDMAGIRPGMRVLDLACGAGSQSIQAAKRVGPDGTVVASDISPAMLKQVRKNMAKAGVQNVETLECAADELDETQAPFDAAICRLGLMLFPEPRQAVAAVRRVLKPGARFSVLTFSSPSNNPILAEPMAILRRHAGKPPPEPGQPGVLALGEEEILEELMKDGGLNDVKTKTVQAALALANASEATQLMQEAAGAYRAVVADLSDADRSKAWSDVHEYMTQFEADHGCEVILELILGSGARPN